MLAIGGGGGGGFGDAAGGGGAGAITYRNDLSIIPLQPYDVIVGRGELGAFNGNMPGLNGQSSDFNSSMLALGGGGGGSTNFNNGNGNSGGYGGGGAFNGSSNGNGGVSQANNSNKGGNAGNSGNGNQRSGGGGGGASGPGNNGNGNSGGNGSNGALVATSCTNCNSFSGILLDVDQSFLSSNGIRTVLAAGGGGVGSNPGQGNGGGIPSAGNGGSSIGGNGNRSGKGNNGLKNTGSGGGAGRDGGGSGGDGVVIIRITYRILPVEFLNFTAAFQSEDRSGNLRWTIGKEWENSHFEIERAVNSIKTWEKIGEVEGQGFSEKPVDYTFDDLALPLSGGTFFYRIKQVDFDGDYTYSITRSIQVAPSKTNESWRASPNPSNTGSRIQIDLLHPERYNDEKIAISLVNQMGNARSAESDSPEHISSFVSEWLRDSPPGMYVVHIQWGAHSEQIKLLRR
ncbi:glycine-rich domain-containing protein [Algoriphagus terrigena]|uniref:glycine-rich domain-containing protein n=1 Tax=Algoriphagus terrigena TaxID=344884 RepID=UPI003CCB9FCC